MHSKKNPGLFSMIRSRATGEVSHTKFWANVAYLAATVCFIKQNWLGAANTEIWWCYLLVVAGHGTASKFLTLKYGQAAK